MTFKCTLPFPKSVNSLFANKNGQKGTGRYITQGYKLWIEEATLHMAKQYPNITPIKPLFDTPVETKYIFSIKDKRRRDISNFIKAPEDFLVRWGVLKDDCLVEKLSAEWTHGEPGVYIEITNKRAV